MTNQEVIKIALFAIARQKDIFSGFEILFEEVNDPKGFEYLIVELHSTNVSKKSYNVFLLPSGKIEVETM